MYLLSRIYSRIQKSISSKQASGLIFRHKTRQHIGQLIKETSAKLKAASEADQSTEISVIQTRWICIHYNNHLWFTALNENFFV